MHSCRNSGNSSDSLPFRLFLQEPGIPLTKEMQKEERRNVACARACGMSACVIMQESNAHKQHDPDHGFFLSRRCLRRHRWRQTHPDQHSDTCDQRKCKISKLRCCQCTRSGSCLRGNASSALQRGCECVAADRPCTDCACSNCHM